MGVEDTIKYIHEDIVHTLSSPSKIVPFLISNLDPKSVVDVGCGTGTFLYEFKRNGLHDVVGIDGKWVDKKKLLISSQEFIETDLELPIYLNREFDMVICLEVAEHLSEISSDILVESLTRLGKTIVFSAALKNQGGQNHINEQSFHYWKSKFEKKGFSTVDFFRPTFWKDTDIQWWYKQNMFLIIHNSIDKNQFNSKRNYFSENHELIHPEMYNDRITELKNTTEMLNQLKSGKVGNLIFYIGLVWKHLLFKFTNSRQ